eukprot:g12402.t1
MWSIVSAVPDVASSTSGRPSGGSETTLWSTYARFMTNDKPPSRELLQLFPTPPDNMSILGLLHCHIDATWKLEKQHLMFCLGSLQPNGLNVDFTSFKI